MAQSSRHLSVTHRINFGLILGSVALLLLVVGGMTGLVLNSKIQDSRSQAAAKRIAKIGVTEKRIRDDGYGVQQISIDASRLKAGSTVTSFKSVLYVPRLSVLSVGNPNTTTSNDPNYVPAAPAGNDQNRTSPPNPGNRPQIKPTTVPSEVPTPDLLATSKDAAVRVWGVNNFREIKDLNVSVETTDDMYLIMISGSTDRKNSTIQTAFAKNIPLLNVILRDKALRWAEVTVKGASIRGFVPGVQTEIELTGSDEPMPTLMPTAVPITSCASDKECGEGKYCHQAQPPCKPGTVCTAMMPSRGYCKQLATCGGIQGVKCSTGYFCKPTYRSPDSTGFCYPDPTPRPLKPVSTCISNEDCKAGQKCIQPPMPTCKPGAGCIEIMPARKCVSSPD